MLKLRKRSVVMKPPAYVLNAQLTKSPYRAYQREVDKLKHHISLSNRGASVDPRIAQKHSLLSFSTY